MHDETRMMRLCVACRKEWGPTYTTCCVEGSLVCVSREGIFKRKTRYFTLDGQPLTQEHLDQMTGDAKARRASQASEEKRLKTQAQTQRPADRPKLAPTPPAATQQATGSLDLPPQFDGKTSYRDMFRILPPEQLRAMCDGLPVERLDLNRPGRPPTAREMGRAVTQVFAVATYMATKEVPAEYGDRLFPRLVATIARYKGSDLNLELCDLVRDFAIQLEAGGRHQQAIQVLRTLRGSLFWRTWPQGDICLFAALSNLALETQQPSHFQAALDFAQELPASQAQQFDGTIRNLKQKMTQPASTAANVPAGTKAELISTIEDLTENDRGGLIKTLDDVAKTIAASNKFSIDVVKELVLEAFFDKMPMEVRKRNDVRSASMKVGAAMGGALFARWLAEKLVVGRSPAQMIDAPYKYGSFGMWQDAKELCEKHGVRFG